MSPNNVPDKATEDIHQDHCQVCYNLKKCRYAKGALIGDRDCPVVSCQLDCGARFHSCKLSEHSLLCSNSVVSCINHYNGCPFTLLRRDISAHLPRCPASVVHCSVEWNRWPAHTREKTNCQANQITSVDSTQLEIALALRDQRTLKELWDAPRKVRCALRNNLTKKYPAVPLKPYQGKKADERQCSQSPTSSSLVGSRATTSDDESESSPWHKSPPGLQKSICSKLVANKTIEHCKPDNEGKREASDPAQVAPTPSLPPVPPKPPQYSLSLDINIDTIAPYQPKPKQMYTFICAKEFRRDEYENHYKNVHSDIHGSVNGWMEHRCPLWQYGCSFTQRRLHPTPVGSKIVLSTDSESLGIVLTSSDEYAHFGTKSPLLALPVEVFKQICKYLDSFSLNNLSISCKQFRASCTLLLDHRGIVVLEWERCNLNGTRKWTVVGKNWMFSTAFSGVDKWHLEDNNSVLKHLADCTHYEKVIRTEPFKLATFDSNPTVFDR